MKITFLLSVFAFFITNTLCTKNDNYIELIHKLKLLEDLDSNGYIVINKYDSTPDNKKIELLKGYFKSFDVVNFILPQDILDFNKLVVESKNGEIFFNENKNTLIELVSIISHYFDIYKYKLYVMCRYNACVIPKYFEISDEELNNLDKKVLGNINLYVNYKNNISLMESIVKKKEERIKILNKNLSILQKQLNNTVAHDCDVGSCAKKRVNLYHDLSYDYFYKKKLKELQAVKNLLTNRITKLKENPAIKVLLDKNKLLLAKDSPVEADFNAVLANDMEIEKIANTIEFNFESLFVDTIELEYYKLEKSINPDKIINNSLLKGSIENIITKYNPKKIYIIGIQHPLSEYQIKKIILERNEYAPFGYLYDTDTIKVINNKNFFIGANVVSGLLRKIEASVIKYKSNLISILNNREIKYLDYKNYKNKYLQTVQEFNELKKKISIPDNKLSTFINNRYGFLKYKYELNKIEGACNKNAMIYFRLRKMDLYLSEFLIKYDYSNLEVEYFNQLKIKLETEITDLEVKTNKLEASLPEIEITDINEFDEQLKANKVLLLNKIQELKKIEILLDRAEENHKLNAAIEYKKFAQLEPYHLIFIKQEVDSITDIIPNIIKMLEIETASLNNLLKTEPDVTTNISEPIPTKNIVVTKQGQQPAPQSVIQQPAQQQSAAPQPEATDQASQSPIQQPAQQQSAEQQPAAPQSAEQQPVTPQSAEQQPVTPQPTEQAVTEQTPQESTEQTPQESTGQKLVELAAHLSAAQESSADLSSAQESSVQAKTVQQQLPQPLQPAQSLQQEEVIQPEVQPAILPAVQPAIQPAVQESTGQQSKGQTTATASVEETPLEVAKKKVNFLKKLLEFLKISHVCHRKILLDNSTMKKSSLNKYKIKENEAGMVRECKSSNLLFKIQNSIPAVYSLYENELGNLQHLQHKLFQLEIVHNLYLLRDDEQIKKILNIPAPQEKILNIYSSKLLKLFETFDDAEHEMITVNVDDENSVINPSATTLPAPSVPVLSATQPNALPVNPAEPGTQASEPGTQAAEPGTQASGPGTQASGPGTQTSVPEASVGVLPGAKTGELPNIEMELLAKTILFNQNPVELTDNYMPIISTQQNEVETSPSSIDNSTSSVYENTTNGTQTGVKGSTERIVQDSLNINTNENTLPQATPIKSTRISAQFGDLTQVENLYQFFLKQNNTYSNRYFLNFVSKNAEAIKNMDEREVKLLDYEMKNVKKNLNSSYEIYERYKLKLHRLLNKKDEILSWKRDAARYNSEKSELKDIINKHKPPTNIHPNFAYFFNIIYENKLEIYKKLSQKTDINYKHSKKCISFNTNELSSIETINPEIIQKEDSYLDLEMFRSFSKIELKNKEIADLNKSNIALLTCAMNYLFVELSIITKNNNYSGVLFNYETIKKNMKFFIDLFPKNSDIIKRFHKEQKAKEIEENALININKRRMLQLKTQRQHFTDLDVFDSSDVTDLNTILANLDNPQVPENVSSNDNSTLQLSASSTVKNVEDDLISFDQNVTNPYLKALINIYKALLNHIKTNIGELNMNFDDVLNSNLFKVKSFLSVLDSYLIEFKHYNLKLNVYLIDNPYKLLKVSEVKMIDRNFKFILKSITEGLEYINSNVIYFNKLKDIYNTQLEQVKGVIAETRSDSINYKFLLSIKNLYEILIGKLPSYIEQLKLKINPYMSQKANIESKINKILDEKSIQIAIARLKKQKNDIEATKNDVNKKDVTTSIEIRVDNENSIQNNSTEKNSTAIKTMKNNILNSQLFDNKYVNIVYTNGSYDILNKLYKISENIKCNNKISCPENSICIKENDKQICKCFLNYMEKNGKCVPNKSNSCKNNNGGCDKTAKCINTNNSITCVCAEGLYPIQGGIVCSSSNFLSLSFLLVILFILYNLF